jgi:Tol biopolymer transport system component
MNADVTEVRQLTEINDSDSGPAWSPDGKHIAFDGSDDEIFVMNADGTGVYSTGQEGYSSSWGG